jgi:hypothetical protein
MLLKYEEEEKKGPIQAPLAPVIIENPELSRP